MAFLELLRFNQMCSLYLFIGSLTDIEYLCLMRQFDKIFIWTEFIQWEKL